MIALFFFYGISKDGFLLFILRNRTAKLEYSLCAIDILFVQEKVDFLMESDKIWVDLSR